MSQDRAPISKTIQPLEALPQAVVAHGRDLQSGEILDFHRHRRAQFIYASDGVMRVTTREASYIVPPQRAVWMPSDIDHRIEARGKVKMRTLYLEPERAADLPVETCVMQVTPLLRELIVEAVASGPEYETHSPAARLVPVILDQIRKQPIASLALPLPEDPRIRRITQALIDNPADERDLDDWAQRVGASRRSLTRLFPAQTGMTFGAWRQQRRLLHAIELLDAGIPVTEIALECGYDNTSAFIAMFRRCVGETPRRYLSTRRVV